MLAAVRSDNCTTVLDNLNCFNASSECLQFVSVNCPEGPSADNFECCSPAVIFFYEWTLHCDFDTRFILVIV